MWLARKPKGKLAAPPKQRDKKSIIVFFIMMVILGAVMPLFGLSVLAIFVIELLIYVFSKYAHSKKHLYYRVQMLFIYYFLFLPLIKKTISTIIINTIIT